MISYRGAALFFLLWGSSAYGCALWMLRKSKYGRFPSKKSYRRKQPQEKTVVLKQEWEDQICEYTKETDDML